MSKIWNLLPVGVFLVLVACGCQAPIPFRSKGVDLKAQERILYIVNNAQRAKEIERAMGLDARTSADIFDLRLRYGPFGFRSLDEIGPLWCIPDDLLQQLFEAFGPATHGRWNTLSYEMQTPSGSALSAAHSAMLHNGKVLLIPESNSTDTVLWDPSDEVTPKFSAPDKQPTDFLFCSGHSFLSDGRLLTVGGGGNFVSAAISSAWIFNPDAGANGEWKSTGMSMKHKRWYPTVASLGHPYHLVAGGIFGTGTPVPQVSKIEIYNEEEDEFDELDSPAGNPTAADREFPETYPGLHVLPTGRILYTHTGFGHSFLPTESSLAAAYLDLSLPAGGTWKQLTGVWTDMTSSVHYPDRTEGMSVQVLSPTAGTVEHKARVIVFGGGQPDTGGRSKAETIRTASLTPTTPWQLIAQHMAVPRFHASAVLLPDGKVLVFGGSEHSDDGTNGYTKVEIFDPSTDKFSAADSLQYSRGYHTVTVLLPSGKVMVSGGINGPNETKIEIYRPPYFFKGSPPSITLAPSLVSHGGSFQIQTPDAASIDKVVLVRPMAFTHHTDTEQRVIELEFTKGAGILTATAPGGIHSMGHAHPLAPRGYYMLFVLNSAGVPSPSKFIRLR